MIERVDVKELNNYKLSQISEIPVHFGSISTPNQIFKLIKKLNEVIDTLNNISEEM